MRVSWTCWCANQAGGLTILATIVDTPIVKFVFTAVPLQRLEITNSGIQRERR